MSFIAEFLIAILLIISGVFGFVGSYGLIKLKDPMQRLHGPTKATTLGMGGVLIASMIYFFVKNGQISVHELIITLFLFLTAPITANFIAKTFMARNLKAEDLPQSGTDFGWSVYSDPPNQESSGS